MTGEHLTPSQREMVEANLGLARWAVSRYAKGLPANGDYTPEDAYQDAVLGLIRAVQGFDPDLGWRFATYAAFWTRHGIQRGMGAARGANWRRAVKHGLPIDAPLSVDHDDFEGVYGPMLSCLEAAAAFDGVESASVVWSIASLAEVVCRDERDRTIFEAYVGGRAPDPYSGTKAFTEELAVELGCSPKTVYARWFAMSRRLRDELGPRT